MVKRKKSLALQAKKVRNLLEQTIPASGYIDDDSNWRPVTAKEIDRDLSPVTQSKMQNIAAWLYDSDPIAKRIIDLKRDFLVGEGIAFEAEESEVMKIISEFWNDPINNMDNFVPDMARDLGLMGEQAFPTFVNEHNGHVRLGYLDPYLIDKIITNPDNCREIIGLKVKNISNYSLNDSDESLISRWRKEQGVPEKGKHQRKYTVVSLNRNANDEQRYGRLTGETFFFAINKVTNATRGRSDLLSLADWIYNYERFLFNRVERAQLLNCFLWDVEIQGKTQEEIDTWLKKQGVPKAASLRAHNEKVKWDAVAPKLESSDASNEAAMFRAHIAGGAGIPVHWLGGGEGLTRACYSDDTEVLTENGWKFYWEIGKEKLADFNPQTGQIEFSRPKGKIYLYPYKGRMFHFKNLRTDILVTPEHRMWVREGHGGKWGFVQAKDIKWRTFYIREAADNGSGVKVLNIADKSLWHFLRKEVGNYSGDKRIPRFLFKKSRTVLEALFKSMMARDGSYSKRPGRKSFFYATKSERLADDFQELTIRLGYSARKRFSLKHDNGKVFKTFYVTCSPTVFRQIKNGEHLAGVHGKRESHVKKINYSGQVFCFKMPHGFMVTRRNGNVAIQGQTALEMSTPVFKHLKFRQMYLKYMVVLILSYVIDQAIIAGRLPKDINRKFSVVFPALSQRDLLSLSNSLSSVAAALTLATDAKLLTSEEAQKHLRFVLNLLGGDMSIPAAEGEPTEGVTEAAKIFEAFDPALAAKLKNLK